MLPKLVEYITSRGIRKSFFAKRLGIAASHFQNMTEGPHAVHPKYWRKIIDLTDGVITLKDLFEAHPDFKDFDIREQPSIIGVVFVSLKKLPLPGQNEPMQ